MAIDDTQRALLAAALAAERIQPLRQVNPGDALQPVKEWTAQFEGKFVLRGEFYGFEVDNSDEVDIPHGLGRPPIGAVVLGFTQFDFGGQPPTLLVDLAASTDRFLRLASDKTFTGKGRVQVF